MHAGRPLRKVFGQANHLRILEGALAFSSMMYLLHIFLPGVASVIYSVGSITMVFALRLLQIAHLNMSSFLRPCRHRHTASLIDQCRAFPPGMLKAATHTENGLPSPSIWTIGG